MRIAPVSVSLGVAMLSGAAAMAAPADTGVGAWLEDFANYSVSGFLWSGAFLAVEITVISMSFGLVLGLGLALLRLSRIGVLRNLAAGYIFVTRGTPQLLQLVFIFDALPAIGLRLDSFTTALIGFALNEAAFSAEIIRGGIASVNSTQSAAAASLGMGYGLTLRRIILPQAMRAILPGLINDTISMLKLTSIASVIFVNELTFRAQQIVGQNFKFFQVFVATGAIYLVLTSAITALQSVLERHFDHERVAAPSVLSRLLGFRGRPDAVVHPPIERAGSSCAVASAPMDALKLRSSAAPAKVSACISLLAPWPWSMRSRAMCWRFASSISNRVRADTPVMPAAASVQTPPLPGVFTTTT